MSLSKLDKLLGIAEQENIIIDYVSFSSNINGLYYREEDMPPIIGINENIVSNTKLFSCVLAEELGHHFTTVGDTTAECYCYADRLVVNKKETVALKWATEFLMPLYEIIDVIRSRGNSFSSIADKLQVTDQFLLKRFEFLSKHNHNIIIDNHTCLELSKLPNIFITKRICT